jgi:hypothetical protein
MYVKNTNLLAILIAPDPQRNSSLLMDGSGGRHASEASEPSERDSAPGVSERNAFATVVTPATERSEESGVTGLEPAI